MKCLSKYFFQAFLKTRDPFSSQSAPKISSFHLLPNGIRAEEVTISEDGDGEARALKVAWIKPRTPFTRYKLNFEQADDEGENTPEPKFLSKDKPGFITKATSGVIYKLTIWTLLNYGGTEMESTPTIIYDLLVPSKVQKLMKNRGGTRSLVFQWNPPIGNYDQYFINWGRKEFLYIN